MLPLAEAAKLWGGSLRTAERRLTGRRTRDSKRFARLRAEGRIVPTNPNWKKNQRTTWSVRRDSLVQVLGSPPPPRADRTLAQLPRAVDSALARSCDEFPTAAIPQPSPRARGGGRERGFVPGPVALRVIGCPSPADYELSVLAEELRAAGLGQVGRRVDDE